VELDAKVVRYADIELIPATHRVTRGHREVPLGLIEFKLLRYFLEHPEQLIGREEIYAAVWLKDMHTESRIVDIHIGRLRKALGLAKGNLIRTVRSIGYILSVRFFNSIENNISGRCHF
jgi:two-component system phosphate regulon response regulator PhoB